MSRFPHIPMAALVLAMILPTGGVSAGSADQNMASPVQPGDALAGKLKRRVIQRVPSSIPGREIVQAETEIPPGVESGWHLHPGEEVGFVIAGTVEMQVRGRSTVILRAGDGFLIPPRTPHNARDIGRETGRMLSTYIVETGQPLVTLVEPHAEK